MQKISLYIYPNRISMVGDIEQCLTEWRIVYQRVVKIYQGVDNTIEFDIKNGLQRRIDVRTLTMRCVVMDQYNQEIYTGNIIPSTNVKGLANFTIPASELTNITPQLLKYSVYIIDNLGNKIPIYGDTNYAMMGQMELMPHVLPTALEPVILDVFSLSYDNDSTAIITHYTSEAGEINAVNDFVSNTLINVEFRPVNLDADVIVQITDYAVISTATIWHDVERFSIAPTTSRVYKSYDNLVDYSNNISWLRVKYTLKNDNKGKLDKVIIRL
jgi:hypothetical protein